MKTISCFSYKGGAGRSTLAMNVVPYIANKLGATSEHPLIVVDMDIDSCGITFLYDLVSDDPAKNKVDKDFNVQRIFSDPANIPRGDKIEDLTLFDYMPGVGHVYGLEDRSILCFPANPMGVMGEDNWDRADDPVRLFVDLCEDCGCCGIIFDSSVGGQLTAGWSNEVSDIILCCMRPTKQFREGTVRFFENFDKNNRRKKIIVIPNVVPTSDPNAIITVREKVRNVNEGVTEVERIYPADAIDSIVEGFVRFEKNKYYLDLVNGDVFGVPKIDRFMWQEGILYNMPNGELNEEEKTAKAQYEKIADIIMNV